MSRIADLNSFMSVSTPGRGVQIKTPFGDMRADTTEDAIRVKREVLAKMEERLGRPPTAQEVRTGPQLVDDRTRDQKYARKNFKPTIVGEDDNLQRLIDDLGPVKEKMPPGLNLVERLRWDAERMKSERSESNDSDFQRKEFLAKVQPQVAKLDQLIESEVWSNGSQLFLDRLNMAKEQLLSNGCPDALAGRMGVVKSMLNERATEKKAIQSAKISQLEAQLASVKSGDDFFETPTPEPEQPIHGSQRTLTPEQSRVAQIRGNAERAEKNFQDAKGSLPMNPTDSDLGRISELKAVAVKTANTLADATTTE